ncbi:MAG: hypothetical protein K2L07_10600 [Lachnospiraceae bacterium]|nr:hypothetical protein [Lachnospiraceae bacterium]
MDLNELVSKYQKKISNDSLLIEYKLFFDNIAKGYCRFAIDECDELEQLNDIILKIKEKDKNAQIYVCTYGVDYMDNGIHIYGDTLWIDTIIDIEKMYGFFKNSREIEPSDIALFDEAIDGIVYLVISADGKVEDYKSFIENRQLDKIKSLYWD